ncbi:hypothetical protein [Amycolatopsis sp. CA-128772]|uniref:hypothetical protein n=1 Tax=Amycolatopsis sp. CA-128772 TaxID=2073159 RepID=UPI000CD29C68|nr:hypothetical protein [Amycolatopsis sp. CA-128772]
MPEACVSITDPGLGERSTVVAGADPVALCEQVLEGLRAWDTAAPCRALPRFPDWFTPTTPSDPPSADGDTTTPGPQTESAAVQRYSALDVDMRKDDADACPL